MANSAFKSSSNSAQKSAPAQLEIPMESNSNKPRGAEVRAIICYPSIETPDERSGGKFNSLFLIQEPEDQEIAIQMVGDTSEETFRTRTLPPGAHNPLRDSNERTPSGEFAFKHPIFRTEGGIVLRAKTSFQPQCVWGPDEVEISPSEIHGGDHVVVQLSTYGYANQSSGVAFSLGRIWLIKKGESRVERGSGAGSAVRRIDRSKIRFTTPETSEAA